jgi:hypothetical protein
MDNPSEVMNSVTVLLIRVDLNHFQQATGNRNAPVIPAVLDFGDGWVVQ